MKIQQAIRKANATLAFIMSEFVSGNLPYSKFIPSWWDSTWNSVSFLVLLPEEGSTCYQESAVKIHDTSVVMMSFSLNEKLRKLRPYCLELEEWEVI